MENWKIEQIEGFGCPETLDYRGFKVLRYYHFGERVHTILDEKGFVLRYNVDNWKVYIDYLLG